MSKGNLRILLFLLGGVLFWTDSFAQITYPDNVSTVNCSFYPEATEWGIRVEWSSDAIASNHITPFVGDLDNDGHPEIVCFALQNEVLSDPKHAKTILVFDGVTHELKQSITMEAYVTSFDAAAYGLVKLSDQKGLIVVAGYDYKLRAYDITSLTPSVPFWVSDVDYGGEYADWSVNVSFADFNADGQPEVYVRNSTDAINFITL